MVVLGRLVAPYGVKGWLHLHPFGDDPGSWSAMPTWWLGIEAAGWREYALDTLKSHGAGWVVKFMGLDDRVAAESLVGCEVAAPREALPKTAEDEYYWTDLIGLDVVGKTGDRLGTVKSLIETAANDVLVVQDGERERLLPFIVQVIQHVDLASRRILVDWEADW